MKKNFLFILLLAFLSCLSGHLLSKASWVGRVGMTFLYQEYSFMKIWWQGATAIFLALLILFLLHLLLFRKLPVIAGRLLAVVILFVADAGFYLTYDDFTNNFAHKLLGHRFHYGVYLFWISWMLICFFFIFRKKKKVVITTSTNKTELTDQ